MKKIALYSGEQIDDLIIKGYKIIQQRNAFRFSLDAILLAHFAYIRSKAQVVDLGTGCGVIALLMAARGAARVIGIEIDAASAEMARRSVFLNELDKIVMIMHADMRELSAILPAEKIDLVVCNPPYRRPGSGKLSTQARICTACHEVSVNFADVVKSAKRLLKYHGRLALIHLPERLPELLSEMVAQGIEPKRMQLVHPFIDRRPNMVLIEGIKGAKPGVEVLKPLIVYNADGSYTQDIRDYYVDKTDSFE